MDTQQRREQEKQARKNEIIEAAAQLFSEKDFHEVTMDEIAVRVGLSKGAVYLYFKNKDDLFFSIIKEKSTNFLEQLRSVIQPELTFNECLKSFVQTYLSFFCEHKPFFKIIHSEKSRMNMDDQHRLRKWTMKIFNEYRTLLTDLITLGQKQQQIRTLAPQDIVTTLRGILNSYTFQRVFLNSTSSIEQDCNNILDIFMNGLKA